MPGIKFNTSQLSYNQQYLEDAATVICYITVVNKYCFSQSLAGYIEAMASRLGLSIPDLTPKQADMWQTRLSAHVVRICNVNVTQLLKNDLTSNTGCCEST